MIVACTSPEREGWLALRLQLWPHHAAEELLAEMSAFCKAPERFAQYLFLSSRGEPQGFAEVSLRTDYVNGTRSSPVAYLEGIFVVPNARRRGIATALVAEAEKWARSRGCREFASDALLHDEASHAMHKALGFQETQRVVFFRKDWNARGDSESGGK